MRRCLILAAISLFVSASAAVHANEYRPLKDFEVHASEAAKADSAFANCIEIIKSLGAQETLWSADQKPKILISKPSEFPFALNEIGVEGGNQDQVVIELKAFYERYATDELVQRMKAVAEAQRAFVFTFATNNLFRINGRTEHMAFYLRRPMHMQGDDIANPIFIRYIPMYFLGHEHPYFEAYSHELMHLADDRFFKEWIDANLVLLRRGEKADAFFDAMYKGSPEKFEASSKMLGVLHVITEVNAHYINGLSHMVAMGRNPSREEIQKFFEEEYWPDAVRGMESQSGPYKFDLNILRLKSGDMGILSSTFQMQREMQKSINRARELKSNSVE